jgi:hypothetical protein
LIGREETTLDTLRQRYHFTGFFTVVTRRRDTPPGP